jgi:hypothetical protein
MPTFLRHRPDAGAGPGALRSSLADAAYAVEDRVALGAGSVADAVKWPFQRIAWAIENHIVWPIREETAGWSRGTRAWSVVALVLLAGGGVAAGIAISNPSSGATQVVTLPGPGGASPTAHHAAVRPSGPVLEGIAPNFDSAAGAGNGKSSGQEEVISSGGATHGGEGVAAAGAKAANEPTPADSESGAAASGPEVAGPAAIKVARRFADAFVLYEIGKTSAHVRKVFAETASPDLAKALLRRPPRLPSNVKVPKARVLNVVVGPTRGDTYTLSVSLLRVGVTSELRLDMKRVPQEPGGGSGDAPTGGSEGEKELAWQVTDVTG